MLDNLIADEIIEPLIAVFLDPRDPNNLSIDRRGSEYRNNINFANYITQELIPDIDAAYKTNALADARAIMGASYGGYNAEYFSAVVPDYFHNIGMNSPYLHPNGDYNIIAELQAAPLDDMVLYMSSGIFDADAERYCNQLKDVFDQKGKEYKYTIIGDGHTWQNWSRVIGDALEYFFAKEETVSLSLTYPNGGEYFISGNTMDIKWDANLISDIKIEFSENNGSAWQEIIASTPASAQSYEWTVPDISSDQCLLKITDVSNNTIFDVSDATFTIGSLQVIGGPYSTDANTVLLLHFEDDLTNSSNLSDDGVSHGSGVSFGTSLNSSFGRCIALDNTNYSNQSHISVPHNENLNLSGSWTMEAWFYLNSMGSDASLNPSFISKANASSQNYFLWYHSSWSTVKGQYSNSLGVDTYTGIGGSPITTGKWYHICYIKDADNSTEKLMLHNAERELIYEQEEFRNPADSEPKLNYEDVLIGKLFGASTFYTDGYIDEVRISNVVRYFSPVGLEKEHSNLKAKSFSLHQNYPNPFNPRTTISYHLLTASQVELTVYNMLGEEIALLVSEQQSAGQHQVNWDASGFTSGIYFYTIKTGTLSVTKKMILIR